MCEINVLIIIIELVVVKVVEVGVIYKLFLGGTHINMWDECVNKWIKWGNKYLCMKKVQLSQLFQLF